MSTSTNFQIETIAKLSTLIIISGGEVPVMSDPDNWEATVLELLDQLSISISQVTQGDLTSLPWSNITSKPTEFPPETHSHQWSQIQNRPLEYPPETHGHGWSEISSKPTTFPPDIHAHPEYEGGLTSVAWVDVTGKPTTFPPDSHGHIIAWADLDGKPSTFPPSTHEHPEYAGGLTEVAWTDITGKPSTFPPDSHSHAIAWADLEGKPTTFPPDTHDHTWGSITSKPATFAPSAHNHLVADLTDFPTLGALAAKSTIADVDVAADAAIAWSKVAHPSTFPAEAHAHAWADVTGKPSTFNAGQIRGVVISSNPPTDNQVLVYSAALSGWIPGPVPSTGRPVGSVIHLPYAVTPTNGVWQDPEGWLWLAPDGLSIGSAASGSNYANAYAQKLFLVLWPNVMGDSSTPGWGKLTSGGNTITVSYESPSTAWSANHRLVIPDMRGRSILGAGQGAGLANRIVATRGGAESQTLTVDHLPSHAHNSSGDVLKWVGTGGSVAATALPGGPIVGGGMTNIGGGQAHGNMHPWKAYKELWFMGVRV